MLSFLFDIAKVQQKKIGAKGMENKEELWKKRK